MFVLFHVHSCLYSVYIVLNDCFTSSMCTICSSIQKHLEPYRLASWVMFLIDTCLFTSASTQVATTLKTVSMYQRIFYPRKQSIGYIDVIYRNILSLYPHDSLAQLLPNRHMDNFYVWNFKHLKYISGVCAYRKIILV